MSNKPRYALKPELVEGFVALANKAARIARENMTVFQIRIDGEVAAEVRANSNDEALQQAKKYAEQHKPEYQTVQVISEDGSPHGPAIYGKNPWNA